jgi:hypothetical protein
MGQVVTPMTAGAAGDDLEVEAPGSGELRFPAIWPRDNCSCPQCRDPRTGQKLHGISDLPEDIAVAGVEDDAETITVTFSPGGHRSRFTRSWLAGHALAGPAPADHRTEDAKRLWQGPAGFTGPGGPRATGNGSAMTPRTGPPACAPCCATGSSWSAACRAGRAW